MLVERIISAFLFRRPVYGEVEKDPSFTSTAWLLVAVIGFLNQLGLYASQGFVGGIIGALVGTAFLLVGFGAAAFVIAWVGRAVFAADVTWDELIRTLGLAYVWNIVGVIGAVAGFIPFLGCVLAPALLIGALMGLISWLVAAKEALDLDWGRTILAVILGWIVLFIITAIASWLLGMLGITSGMFPVPQPG